MAGRLLTCYPPLAGATVARSVAVHTGSTHDHLAPSGACETTQGIVLWVPDGGGDAPLGSDCSWV